MPIEKEIAIIQKAAIYDLIGLLETDSKQEYTVEEIKELMKAYIKDTEQKRGNDEMSEVSRLILGLRAQDWSVEEIQDLILWVGTGEEQYRPKNKAQ